MNFWKIQTKSAYSWVGLINKNFSVIFSITYTVYQISSDMSVRVYVRVRRTLLHTLVIFTFQSIKMVQKVGGKAFILLVCGMNMAFLLDLVSFKLILMVLLKN